MRRRDFLKTMGIGAAAAGVQVAAGAAERQPNVVLVMTDDQGYGDLGCHGNPVIKTPNLDALHAESVRMTSFQVCPTCSPTRAALMTGHYSLRAGIWHTIMGRSIMRPDEVTMGDVFSANGYRTGIFGKWHLGDNYPYRPQDRGFQEVVIHGGGGVGQTPDYWGNDYFDDTYFDNGVPKQYEGYCTDVWFDEALGFIRKHQDRPFFAYISTNAPHSPYHVADKYSAQYKGKNGVVNADFYGMITNIDENMGRLMDTLRELGLEENTILVFMTDNGSAAGARRAKDQTVKAGYNAGMRRMKGSPYEGGHRVPCFIRWPARGIEGGRDVNRISAHFDLLPTLIGLCGIEPPEDVTFDGRDLTPLLEDSDAAWPDRTIFVDTQRIEQPEKWRNSAAMTDRWRLINGRLLFDIEADPGQTKDVADKHPEIVARLRKDYDAWWADISQGFDEYSRLVLGAAGAVLLFHQDIGAAIASFGGGGGGGGNVAPTGGLGLLAPLGRRLRGE